MKNVAGNYGQVVDALLQERFSPASYNKHKPIRSIAQSIEQLARHATGKPLLVGIGGAAGSGKSYLVQALQQELGSKAVITVIDQDRYFVPRGKTVSGHHPFARDRKALYQELQKVKRTLARYPCLPKDVSHIVLCHSNAAFLFSDVRSLYDVMVGVCVRDEQILFVRRTQKEGSTFSRRHFYSVTLPDITRHTLPSLRFCQLLYCTDINRVYVNQAVLHTSEGQEFFYSLSADSDGWDRLWQTHPNRFTARPAPLCTAAIELLPVRGQTVVEIGAGATGRDALAFIAAGARYIGIEISSTAARHLRDVIQRKSKKTVRLIASHEELQSLGTQAWRGENPIVIAGDFLRVLPFLPMHYLSYSHSSLHYFPPAVLERILQAIHLQTRYLAVGVKTTQDRLAKRGDAVFGANHGRIYENDIHRQVRFFFTPRRFKHILSKAGFSVERLYIATEEFDAVKKDAERQSPFINVIARA